MSGDREAAVKKAEDLVREGKPDLAIEEYLRLVEDQPGDVGAANALGDLYTKVGNRASAVAQFVQIGDTHRESGFIPKAVAFYKKALKVDPASDHALSQLAHIAVGQELFADATLYLNRLLQRRREQDDEAGVAECLVRLGGFPSATADAKTAAARAAAGHLAPSEVSRLWIEAADALERAGRPREAVDVLLQAAGAGTDDGALARRVAVACADTGQIARAHAFLSFDIAGDRGDLLMALARHALGEGRDDEARRALQHVILVAPELRLEAESLLAPLLPREPDGPAGEVTTDQVTTAEVTIDEFYGADAEAPTAAAESLMADDWGVVSPDTAPLAPDVEPEVVAGLESNAPPAGDERRQDADAEPASTVEEPQMIAGAAAEHGWSLLATEDVEEDAGSGIGDEMPVPFELAGLEADAADAAFVVDDGEALDAELSEPDAEAVFQQVTEPEPQPLLPPPPAEAPALQLSAADASTIAALTAAAENPALLFQASAQLGRLLLRLDRGREGVAWLERATQATTAVREQRLGVMYELADALERIGERARALDAFADLDFDAASYRDVPERMDRLRRALEEGRAL